ncbi:hypothetical protein EZS27_006487 [termite gut metagenome]|uniref:Uncharacterized protein n=1 Tax=termite gut metagenome TaxID=433724 RepID=A0A5J4SJ38_9ZZZZ
MEKLIVNNDNEKRCIFSEILKMQRDGIISNSDTLKTLQFASNNIRNKYNKPIIERSSYTIIGNILRKAKYLCK